MSWQGGRGRLGEEGATKLERVWAARLTGDRRGSSDTLLQREKERGDFF